MNEVIKCNKCNHVLISGNISASIFGKGTSIECMKCGNKYIFKDENEDSNIKKIGVKFEV